VRVIAVVVMSHSFIHTAFKEDTSRSDVLAALQYSVDDVLTELGRCHSSLRVQKSQWNGLTPYARSDQLLCYLEDVAVTNRDLEADALKALRSHGNLDHLLRPFNQSGSHPPVDIRISNNQIKGNLPANQPEVVRNRYWASEIFKPTNQVPHSQVIEALTDHIDAIIRGVNQGIAQRYGDKAWTLPPSIRRQPEATRAQELLNYFEKYSGNELLFEIFKDTLYSFNDLKATILL